MNISIYINNVETPVRAEILPSYTPTLDETLETFSFALISNSNPLPLAPMQKVKVDFLGDGTDVAYFYIVSDSVETYSLKPLKYKHSISCIQNTRKLSKHLVRNSAFTQPAYLTKSAFNAESAYSDSYISGQAINFGNSDIPSLNWASEKLVLDSISNYKKEKIKSAKLKISFQFIFDYFDANAERHYTANTSCHNAAEILAAIDNAQQGVPVNCIESLNIANTLTLQYDDADGNPQTPETISATDLWGISYFDLNRTYEFPRIKELANQGFKNFEILFDSLNFVTGTYKQNISASPAPPQLRFYMVQVEIIAETYYYNCYELLELLARRQKKETSLRTGIESLFILPIRSQDPDLYDLLTKTPAPNFTFTQLTMYECVAEVFRIFDAIFTINNNNVLGIEYFNDLSKETITPRLTGRTTALGEDKYTNGLVSNYQDGRVIESFPINEGTFAPLRSEEFGVPEEQDHSFIVPHHIDSVIKCEVLSGLTLETAGIPNCGEFAVDITRYVFEESIWSTLEKGDFDPTDKTAMQCNSVYFSKGDNKLKVAASQKDSWRLTNIFPLYNATNIAFMRMAGTDLATNYKPSDDIKKTWYAVKMRLTYIASVDGKTQVHSLIAKYPGETLVDQVNGAVDLNKMGLNMLGLSLKLGNPTLNATHRITSWANRVKQGQIYEWTVDGKTTNWVANVVNYTFFNGMIQGKISFVQNFNQLALRTQLLREKRMTNISQELVMKSEEILTDFVYFSSATFTEQGDAIHFDSNALYDFTCSSFDISNNNPPKFGDAYLIKGFNDGIDTNVVYIPMVRYGAGNTINFEMSFDHPISAGNQTKYTDHVYWLGQGKYFTNYVNYTDKNGFLDFANIIVPIEKLEYNDNFPRAKVADLNSYYLKIANFEAFKQPNEIFAVNYQLAFLPYPGRENTDFIGNELINNNCFINSYGSIKRNLRVIFRDEKSSILDIKYVSKTSDVSRNVLIVDRINDGNNKFHINIRFTSWSLSNEAKSWLVVDENDNILFASNKKLGSNANEVNIYFMPKLNRLI